MIKTVFEEIFDEGVAVGEASTVVRIIENPFPSGFQGDRQPRYGYQRYRGS